jgi:hypothetical protein
MRRSTTLALCFAALPLFAAKGLIDNEGYAVLTDNVLGGKVQQLHFTTAQWGPRQSAGRTVSGEVFYKPPAGSSRTEDMPKDLQAQDRMGDPASAGGHSMLGASDKTTLHDPPPPRDGGLGSESELTSASSQTGPRQSSGRYLDLRPRPLDSGPGTLVVQGAFPGCTVGKRYAGMQFASGGMRYELKDVVISNCPTAAGPKEEITFVYGTVKVKGWDPKKKEG